MGFFFACWFVFGIVAAKGLPDMDSSILIHHNGGIPANKKLSTTLPEIEYREKGKEKDKDAKKHNLGINNNNILDYILEISTDIDRID